VLSNSVGFNNAQYLPPIRYTPNFQATGLVFTGSNSTHPAYNSYYVKDGYMVSFWIQINMTTVTNFGTGQFKVDLPFPPHVGTSNHFPGWVWYDPTGGDPDLANHIILNVDHLPGSQTLDLHWLGGDTPTPKPVREYVFTGTSPYTLNTASKIYINGTYFTDVL
jgi:hypothetical protein